MEPYRYNLGFSTESVYVGVFAVAAEILTIAFGISALVPRPSFPALASSAVLASSCGL